MKFNFNPLKKIVTGAALFAATTGQAAEKPETVSEDLPKNTTEYVADSKSEMHTEALDFAKEQQRIVLEGKKLDFEHDIKRLEMLIRTARTDFVTRFNEIKKFQGESVAHEDTIAYLEHAHNLAEKLQDSKGKAKVSDESVKYLPQVLIDAAMNMAQEHLGKKGVNVSSDENVEGLINILLDESGPLGSEIAKFDKLLSEQLGSTVHGRLTNENTNEALDITSRDDRAVMEKRNVTKNSFGQKSIGSFNEDMDQHQALGKIAKESIKLGVTLADRKYKLDKVEKELEALMDVPDELAQN